MKIRLTRKAAGFGHGDTAPTEVSVVEVPDGSPVPSNGTQVPEETPVSPWHVPAANSDIELAKE